MDDDTFILEELNKALSAAYEWLNIETVYITSGGGYPTLAISSELKNVIASIVIKDLESRIKDVGNRLEKVN